MNNFNATPAHESAANKMAAPVTIRSNDYERADGFIDLTPAELRHARLGVAAYQVERGIGQGAAPAVEPTR